MAIQNNKLLNLAGGKVLYDDLRGRIESIDTTGPLAVSESTKAKAAHSVGEIIAMNGEIYVVTAAIAKNATIAVGTNIARTKIADQLGLKANKNNAQFSGVANMADGLTAKFLNAVAVGTGTAGQAGTSATATNPSAYIPSLWTFGLGLSPVEGDTLLVKVPVAGVNAGIWMSVDNGTTYYPVAATNTAALTTTYPVDSIVMLTFENNRNTTIYGTSTSGAPAGSSAAAYTSDRWVVTNYYANTTYSTMSSTEMNTGTATTGRLISASLLATKANKANPVFTGSISLDRSGSAGTGSLAVGSSVTASGDCSTATGGGTYAYGRNSHAEGTSTIATGQSTHVFGKNNEDLNSGTEPTAYGPYVEMVGNGDSYSNRSNARTLDWNGNETITGHFKCNSKIQIGDTSLTEAQLYALVSILSVTSSDNGKFLRVVNGSWAASSIANANGVGF